MLSVDLSGSLKNHCFFLIFTKAGSNSEWRHVSAPVKAWGMECCAPHLKWQENCLWVLPPQAVNRPSSSTSHQHSQLSLGSVLHPFHLSLLHHNSKITHFKIGPEKRNMQFRVWPPLLKTVMKAHHLLLLSGAPVLKQVSCIRASCSIDACWNIYGTKYHCSTSLKALSWTTCLERPSMWHL